MAPATIDVDPDVFHSAGSRFLAANDAVCDIVAAAANAADTAGGMAGVDSTGAAWARDYDDATWALLRAGSTAVDALGALGDRLRMTGANHDEAETASVPGGGPPTYSGTPGGSRAVGVVVAPPPSADGTPADPPPGWPLIAHLVAYTWPAGHPDQLRAVATGWLTASLSLSDEADRLSASIADIAGQTSPEVPYALATCTDLQDALRELADQYAIVAQVCNGYANHLDSAHRDVLAELIELVADEAVIEMAAAFGAAATAGGAEVAGQAVAGARISTAAVRVGRILVELAAGVVALENLVEGVAEHVLGVLLTLREVADGRQTLQAVTALLDAHIPPVDLQANDAANTGAHVIKAHVAKSDAYLVGRNIPIASTFTSLAAATTAISTVIATSGPDIEAWLAGTDETYTLSGLLPAGFGRSYLRESGQFVNATRLKVVLGRNSHGWYIITAYPEP